MFYILPGVVVISQEYIKLYLISVFNERKLYLQKCLHI